MKRNIGVTLLTVLIVASMLCGCGTDTDVNTNIISENDVSSEENSITSEDMEAATEQLKIETLARNYLPDEIIDMSVEDKTNIEKLISGTFEEHKADEAITSEMFDLTVFNRKITLTETNFMEFVKSFDGYNEHLSSDFIDWDFQVYPFTEVQYVIYFSDCPLTIYTANPTQEIKSLSELAITGVERNIYLSNLPELQGDREDFFYTRLYDWNREGSLDGSDLAVYTNVDTGESLRLSKDGCIWVYKLHGDDIEFIKEMSSNDLYDATLDEDANGVADSYSSELGSYTVQVFDKIINLEEHTIADVLKEFDSRTTEFDSNYHSYSYMLYKAENNLVTESASSKFNGLFSFITFYNIDEYLHVNVAPLDVNYGNLWTTPLKSIDMDIFNYDSNITDCFGVLQFNTLTTQEELIQFNNEYYADNEYRIISEDNMATADYFTIEVADIKNDNTDRRVKSGELGDYTSVSDDRTYGDNIDYSIDLENIDGTTYVMIGIDVSRFDTRISED